MVDARAERDDLIIKRNALFKRYSRKPNDLQLAVEIKTLDDAIAGCMEKITQDILLQYEKSRAGASES